MLQNPENWLQSLFRRKEQKITKPQLEYQIQASRQAMEILATRLEEEQLIYQERLGKYMHFKFVKSQSDIKKVKMAYFGLRKKIEAVQLSLDTLSDEMKHQEVTVLVQKEATSQLKVLEEIEDYLGKELGYLKQLSLQIEKA